MVESVPGAGAGTIVYAATRPMLSARPAKPIVHRHAALYWSMFALTIAAMLFLALLSFGVDIAETGPLAVIAAVIDAFVKGRARPLSVTLTSSSSIMSPASSQSRLPVMGVGSNEFTSVRPPAEAERPAGQLSESGNRA